jgi:hypothetical protein
MSIDVPVFAARITLRPVSAAEGKLREEEGQPWVRTLVARLLQRLPG